MDRKALHDPFYPIQNETEYQVAVARFWELVGTSTDLTELLTLREAMRAYEKLHPDANAGSAAPTGPGGR